MRDSKIGGIFSANIIERWLSVETRARKQTNQYNLVTLSPLEWNGE